MGGRGELKGWLPLAETARAAGVSERTMRRRMVALHQKLDGGVLRSYNLKGKTRKWFVNPQALLAGVEDDPDEAERGLGEHLLRIEELEKRLDALRQSHNALKRKTNVSISALELAFRDGHRRP
jgi:hypothetical protein